MKLGVFCVLAVSVAGLMAMLIQGCKRETETADNTDNSASTVDTNAGRSMDTNAPSMEHRIRRWLVEPAAGGCADSSARA